MATSTTAKPKIGIIISMFPELHETFILRELVALERHGVDFEIFSLQYPRDPITIDEAIRLSRDKTHYSKLFTVATIWAITKTKLCHPIEYVKTVAKMSWIGRDRPREVIKNLAILPLALRYAEIGKERGITHWHGHWANIPTTACWVLQQLYGISWSAAIHGEDIFTHNRFLQRKLDDADFSVVCSGYFCAHLKENIGLESPENVHLNYHGLDPLVMQRAAPRRFKPRGSEGVMRLVSIGRLVPTKGHDVLIKAMAVLTKTTDLDLTLTLIGSGPLEKSLKSLASAEGVADRVEFMGGVAFSTVLDIMEASDLFCLAPRLLPGEPPDGIPNVIAEAMALGIPVVSTAVSAIPELIDDGVSGYLVCADDVEGFAERVALIASNPDLAEEISQAGFEKVGRLFDQDQNIKDLIDLFKRYVPGAAVP